MNRRNFMGASLAGAGMLAGFEDIVNEQAAPFQFENKLSLKVFGTNWGFVGDTDQFCAAIKKEGYDGTEMWWPGSKERQTTLLTALKSMICKLAFYAVRERNNMLRIWTFSKSRSMRQHQSLVRDRFTSTATAEEIISLTNKTRRL